MGCIAPPKKKTNVSKIPTQKRKKSQKNQNIKQSQLKSQKADIKYSTQVVNIVEDDQLKGKQTVKINIDYEKKQNIQFSRRSDYMDQSEKNVDLEPITQKKNIDFTMADQHELQSTSIKTFIYDQQLSPLKY